MRRAVSMAVCKMVAFELLSISGAVEKSSGTKYLCSCYDKLDDSRHDRVIDAPGISVPTTDVDAARHCKTVPSASRVFNGSLPEQVGCTEDLLEERSGS